MKKILLVISILIASAAHLSATVYYSNGTGTLFPTAGASWNTQADGSGSAGFSTTYTYPLNDLVLQSGHVMLVNPNTGGTTWGGQSYTMQAGSTFITRNGYNYNADFTNGNITAGGNISFINGSVAGAGNSVGGVIGSAQLFLGAYTLLLDESTSTASGVYEFGLNVVGNGMIDFDFANANITWNLSNLSSSYTGIIQGDTFNGILQLGAGDAAINAGVVIGRADQTRTGKLDLNSSFSLRALDIDGVSVTDGIYTYAQLVDFGTAHSADFSNNLVDNGGTLFIGQVVPEPATLGLVGVFGFLLLLYRRFFLR